MVFQVVDLGLLEVADIGYTHRDLPDREVEGYHLTEGRTVVEGGKQDILSFVSQGEHFIV